MSPRKSPNEDLAAQIKKDMVNYIGPIFQDLKGDINDIRSDNSKLNKRIDSLAGETHKLGILMEQMDKKIDTALEASSSVLKYEDIVKDHDDRIVTLERDVRVLKLVRSPKP